MPTLGQRIKINPTKPTWAGRGKGWLPGGSPEEFGVLVQNRTWRDARKVHPQMWTPMPIPNCMPLLLIPQPRICPLPSASRSSQPHLLQKVPSDYSASPHSPKPHLCFLPPQNPPDTSSVSLPMQCQSVTAGRHRLPLLPAWGSIFLHIHWEVFLHVDEAFPVSLGLIVYFSC